MKINIICYIEAYKYFEDYINGITKNSNYNIIKYNFSDIIKLDVTSESIFIFVSEIPHIIENTIQLQSNKIFILNFEQLTISKYSQLKKLSNIIDYSEENISLYENKNNVFHIPYQIDKNEIYDFNKDFDVCILGSFNGKRNRMIKRLKAYNITVNKITGWDKDRDYQLFKHKILLNIHYENEYNIMEQLRINRCIYNKMIVISEDSINSSLLPLTKHMIICNYNDIPTKVIEVLNNYNTIHKNLFDDFDINIHINKTKEKLNYFLSKINTYEH